MTRLQVHPWRALAVSAVSGLLLLAWWLVSPEVAVAGWLVGFLFWLCVALGAYVLLTAHALTSGRWLAPLRPVLAPAVASLPLFALAALPLLLQAGLIWPWVANPSLARHEDVARLYLNLPGLALRGAVMLAGWSLFGLLMAGGGGRRPGLGAPALAFYALSIGILGLDWILSLDPHFRSTAFGMWLGVTQVLAALSWCALLHPEPAGGNGKAGDLAKLLLAAALGAIYLGFVQYLVVWYGNLPEKVTWYMRRDVLPWVALEGLALAATAILPVVALLPVAARRSPRALTWIGGGVLVGHWAHLTWLVGPSFGGWLLLSGLLGTAAMGGIWIAAWAGLAGRFLDEPLHREVGHGA